MKTKVLMLLALGAALPLASRAAEVRPVVVAGIDTGGDKIVEAPLTNGDTATIRANEGLYVGGGVSVINDDKNLEFVGTLNYKYRGISAYNGTITWTQVPIDALGFYRWEKFRLGAGATYHMSPRIHGTGVVAGNISVDNALGGVVQGDFLLGKVNIGLRFTHITYKNSNGSAKGDGVGLTFGYTF